MGHLERAPLEALEWVLPVLRAVRVGGFVGFLFHGSGLEELDSMDQTSRVHSGGLRKMCTPRDLP